MNQHPINCYSKNLKIGLQQNAQAEYDSFNISFILHVKMQRLKYLNDFSIPACHCVLPFGEENRPSSYKLWISRKQKYSKHNEEESDRSFCKSRSKEDILTQLMLRSRKCIYVGILCDLLYWAKFLVVFINNSFCFCFCSFPFIMFANTKSA